MKKTKLEKLQIRARILANKMQNTTIDFKESWEARLQYTETIREIEKIIGK